MNTTEKVFLAFEEYMKDKDIKEEDLERELQNFVQIYNANEDVFNKRFDALDMMELAYNAETEKEAKKYANKALKLDPDNLDAKVFLVDFEKSALVFEKKLDDLIQEEEEKLRSQKFFSEENIGSFYGVLETRPYVRALFKKMNTNVQAGRYLSAQQICENILKLNENDNMGVRYTLMTLYAFFEDEGNIVKLYEKFDEMSCLMILPLAVFWYKKGNIEELDATLNTLYESNHFIIKKIKNFFVAPSILGMPNPYYSQGDEEEATIALRDNIILLLTTQGFVGYVTNWKHQKNRS